MPSARSEDKNLRQTMVIMRKLWPWLAAASSGVLLTLCFAPFDQAWLVWVALAPLLAAIWFGPVHPKYPK